MLPPQSRLRRSEDIGRVRQSGQRWQHPLVVLFVYTQPQELPPSTPDRAASRFAFAVGRHIGKAARRNRVKRRLREIVRLRLDDVEPGHDCLFVARAGAATSGYAQLEEAVLQLLRRSGVLIDVRAEPGVGGSPS